METTYYEPGHGYPTPWGTAQTRTRYNDQISAYTTSSHGGIKVNAKANQRIHPVWRDPNGWYEEDLCAYIVALAFPDVLGIAVQDSEKALKDWYPHEFETATGQTVELAESAALREEGFRAAHVGDYVARSAFGDWADWVPDGKVGVYARRESDDDEQRFLIDADEYHNRDGRFVIDERRHEAV